jgi:ubiquitin-protein ligase E3 C
LVFDVSSPRNVFTAPSCSDSAQFDALMSLVAVLRVALIALDDSEIYEQNKPLPLHQTVALVRCLKVVLYRMIQSDPQLMLDAHEDGNSASGKQSSSFDQDEAAKNINTHRFACARSISAVLSDLYTRWARRPFSATALWEIGDTSTSAVKDEIRRRSPFAIALLRVMPWAVDFHQRMKLFRAIADAERAEVQGVNDILSGGGGYRSKGQVIRVRKARILEDGMAAMGKISGAGLKDRVVVRYVNEFGEDEAGIDIGGLFKDFVTDLSARIFDPNYGLFCLTAANVLYPNPAATLLFDRHELDEMYIFLGRVLGKALYENITLQPQFAHFFLAFMHGRYNFMSLVNDLSTLDPELYRNLMFLKAYEGDIADLSLTFAITDTALGGNSEIELVPGGGNLYVNSSNRCACM